MKISATALVVCLMMPAPVMAQHGPSNGWEISGPTDGRLRLSGPWSIGPRLGLARAGLSVAAFEGRIYAAGGAGLVDPRDDFEVFEPERGDWRPLKPMPVGLERFGMTAAQGRIYVAGGYAADTEDGAAPVDQVWSYDPEMDVWRGETALPGPRAGLSLVTHGDNIYALGGEDGTPGLFVFNLASQEWGVVDAPLEINRRGAAAVVLGDEIWLIGGAREGKASNRVDIYHTTSQTWRRGLDLPEPRAGHSAAVLGEQVHIFGGRSADMRRTLASHLSFSEGAEQWEIYADMPAARTEAGVANLEGGVWLIGGGAGAGFFAPFTAIDAVDIFSPRD